jgi:cell division protein FtsQ
VTGARLVGGRRWDVYLDGRIEVRLPANRPRAAWRRLAQEQKASGVISRAVTSIDFRSPDWLTLEMPDAVIGQGKEPRA